MSAENITFIAAVNNRLVLERNLLRSPALAPGHRHELLIKEGFSSASLAYNDAIKEATGDLLVFIHQDIYLPPDWLPNTLVAIDKLDRRGIRWGVLGCFGVRPQGQGSVGLGQVYSTGWGLQGDPISQPEPVQTLDEIVLITRASNGLCFDASLPNFHLYGTDLCLTASARGFQNFAIPAFCVHNTNQLLELPSEFYNCYSHVKKKWKHQLPIYTSCIAITRFDADMVKRRLRAAVLRQLKKQGTPALRIEDPRTAISAVGKLASR